MLSVRKSILDQSMGWGPVAGDAGAAGGAGCAKLGDAN
jgi:hypothetical protein